MSNPDREIDKTSLSIDTVEERGFLHRDYIAHCLRWSHVVRFLMQKHNYNQMPVLDIGCGKEVPLAKLIYSSRMTGSVYYGLDANKLALPEMLEVAVANQQMYIKLFGQTLFSDLDLTQLRPYPKIFVALEVTEHMAPKICIEFLKKLYHAMIPEEATAFISTPNFNGKAAANHINELPYDVLYAILDRIGFRVDGVWGTFASQSEIKQPLFDIFGIKFAYEKLAKYYDSNLLSILFAPLMPEHSRNCLWQLSRRAIPKAYTMSVVNAVLANGCQHKDVGPYLELE